MSRTWRKEERLSRGRRERAGAACEAESAEPRVISPDWAWERVRDHAFAALAQLVEEGVVLDGEEDIHAEGIRRALDEAAVRYDPTWTGPDGRKCSPSHYCLMIVDRRISNIRRSVARAKGEADERPISALPAGEAERRGFVSEESISDGCRNIRELWFRMDVNELVGMLTPFELEVLDLRQDDVSEREIACRLGIGRYDVTRVMGRIREKARECGFFPASEVKSGRDGKYFLPNRKNR